jgi:hypothetical protein
MKLFMRNFAVAAAGAALFIGCQSGALRPTDDGKTGVTKQAVEANVAGAGGVAGGMPGDAGAGGMPGGAGAGGVAMGGAAGAGGMPGDAGAGGVAMGGAAGAGGDDSCPVDGDAGADAAYNAAPLPPCFAGACAADDSSSSSGGLGATDSGTDSGSGDCVAGGGDLASCGGAPADKVPGPGKPPDGATYTQLDGTACKWLYDNYLSKSIGGVCGLRRWQWAPDGVNEENAKRIAKVCGAKPTPVEKLKCVSAEVRAWLGPFCKQRFVCRHNAVATYWVLQEMGYSPEVEVDEDYKHAWTSVEIDGVRYHIDSMNNCVLSINPAK